MDSKAPPGAAASFIARFTVLFGAVRELWIVFGVKLIGIAAYGVMNSTLVLWLSSDLGFGDVKAGTIVTAWSSLMTLTTVLVGSLTDAIGLRKAFLIGIWICVFSRLTMTASTAWPVALGLGLLPLALGEALLGPVMVAAIKRCTSVAQRSISFSIFYAMMNAGYAIANLLFDLVRKGLGEYGRLAMPVGGEISTYRTLFLISLLLTIPNLILLQFFFREGVEVTDTGVQLVPPRQKSHGPLLRQAWASTRDALRETLRIFGGLWRQSGFYKFLVFLSLAAFVRLIFFHLFYTYPKFGIRELGEGAPVGRLFMVNSVLIMVLVPIVGALTQRISAYRMVVGGSTIAALSVFVMALPPQWFTGLANGFLGDAVGHWYLGVEGVVHPYYVMIFLFITTLSVGEAFYSPRLYEYAAAIAPKGQEASYMALSYLPFFLAKSIVGVFSGILLEYFCPAVGPRNSQMLWLIIALTTAIAPLGLFVLRPYIQVKEAGREET